MAYIKVQYGRPSRFSWVKSLWSSFGRTIVGKAIWENPIETWLGENSKLWMSLCSSLQRIILICFCGWHKIGWKETKYWSDVESTQRSWFERNQHLSWIMYTWAALKDNVKLAKILWTITEPCLNLEFPLKEVTNFHTPIIFVFLRGLMTWKVMRRNFCRDIAS